MKHKLKLTPAEEIRRDPWIVVKKCWIGLDVDADCSCPFFQNVYEVTESNPDTSVVRHRVEAGEACYASEHEGEGFVALASLFEIYRCKANRVDRTAKVIAR